MPTPLFRAIDSVQLPVRDLAAAVAFYGDRLGHRLAWRTEEAAGFALSDQDDAEIVVQVARPDTETDLLVDDVDGAIDRWTAAGGTVDVEPFDIAIGRCAVVRDPFGNPLVMVDMSRGPITAPIRT
jgi:predicted enzyme related to lactoylglutathione lyase